MNITFDNFAAQVIQDLKLAKAPEEEQQRALSMLQDRFNNVVIETLVSLADTNQKTRLKVALEQNDKVEETISDIASSIPSFSDIVEQALLAEYQSIKQVVQS